jgi:phosphopantothenoylcysteine decarboxylase/phosphopantothenate--cysteine ligase
MHARMWEQPATRRNVERLEADGHHIVRPTVGALASGEVGAGRMAEPDVIVAALERLLGGEVRDDLAGRRIVVTAGPTAEDLDPVRFFTNRSSGRMGYALAERAAARGATVTLVSGPVTLSTTPDVHRVDVRSARDMQRAVATAAEGADVVIMAAAVADYRPAEESEHKLRKSEGPLTLELARNPDILADLGANRHGPTPMLIGFAVETQDLIQRARDKLSRKGADLIVANAASIGFGGEDNDAVLVDAEGEDAVGAMSKRELADRILDRVVRARPAAGA